MMVAVTRRALDWNLLLLPLPVAWQVWKTSSPRLNWGGGFMIELERKVRPYFVFGLAWGRCACGISFVLAWPPDAVLTMEE